MKEEDIIYIASKYAEKGYDIEQLQYGDDMYEKGQFIDDVWEYIIEYKEIGSIAFRKKYSKYKLYS